MSALAAARTGDEIAHGFGLAAMVAGAVVGAVAGVAVVGAIGLTGGLAAVVIAGAVATGGLSGKQILNGLSQIFNLPEPTSGLLGPGSPNVMTNKRPAARAVLTAAVSCNGLPFNHPPLPLPIPVQQGSKTVIINSQPASRLKSKLMCGAHIKSGSPNVFIGGEETTVGFIFDLEGWFEQGLQVLGLAALIGGGLFAAAAGFAAFATFAGVGLLGYGAFEGLGMIGDAIGPGYRDLLQGIAGMAMVVAGPKIARRGAPRADADPPLAPPPGDKVPDGVPMTQKKFDEIRGLDNKYRPPPEDYLPPAYREQHLKKFDEGGSYLVRTKTLDDYGRNPVGRGDGQFIMPKSEMDDLMARTGGDVGRIEQELGIPKGSWNRPGETMSRVDIPNPRSLDLRMPSGNEDGANPLWMPGGKLPGGGSEAVVNAIPKGSYIETIFGGGK